MGMPRLDINKVPPEHRALVSRIIATQGKNKGCLRASKPPTPRKVRVDLLRGYTYRYADEEGRKAGEASYVWRMVAFYCSPLSQHMCMPMTADFDLDGSVSEARERAKELDAIVDIVVEQVPLHLRHGLIRWGRALGYM